MKTKGIFCSLMSGAGRIDEVLQKEGLELVVVEKLEDFERELDKETFQIAIIDGAKPDSLYPIGERLRAHKDHKECPILFMALRKIAFDSPFKGFDTAPIEFVLKPYAAEDFANRIRLLIKVANQKRDLMLALTEVARQKSDMAAILQNIQQGIFTLTFGLKAQPEYSRYLTTILGTSAIEGHSIDSLLLAASDLDENRKAEILTVLEAGFDEDQFSWDLNRHLLPRKLTRKTENNGTRELEIEWNPIFRDGLVEKIMTTVRDVTELNQLERAAKEKDVELNILCEVLSIPHVRFQSFVDHAREKIFQGINNLKTRTSSNEEVCTQILKDIHTLKGNARSCGLSEISSLLHETEEHFVTVRSGTQNFDSQALTEHLLTVRDRIELYCTIWKDKIGKRSESTGKLRDWQIAEIANVVDELKPVVPAAYQNKLEQVKFLTDTSAWETVEDCLYGIIDTVPATAEQLGKLPPKVVMDNGRLRVKAGLRNTFENIFNHLIRNSLDHGIETPAERSKLGKNPEGQIQISSKVSEQGLEIVYEDDGLGLNLVKLEKLQKPGKKLRTSDEDIAELIFETGVSTAEKVTQISGRGIGMDAVRSMLEDIGGSIELNFKGPRSHEHRPVRFRIRLPIDLVSDHSMSVTRNLLKVSN